MQLRRKADTETPPLTTAEKILQLDATIARLRGLETQAHAAAIEAFKTHGNRPPEPEGRTAIKRAAEMLLAGIDVLDRPEAPQARLMAADERVAAVREALRIALNQRAQLLHERSYEVEREILKTWRPHMAEVVEHVNQLRRLARERRALIREWKNRTGIEPSPIGCDLADQLISVNNGFADDPNEIHGDSPCGRLLAAAAELGVG